MARSNIVKIRQFDNTDLREQIEATRRELFDLRFQQATRRLENPHRFKRARIKLAQLLTVQKERISSVIAS
uniref:Large ribosomal subunit protein uL29c n=1 Tax=Paulinella chromatophora TaxID=39717 RepID=B1X500_PAUCH|nr:50S ribosomal protein L29 [Paulinella chromatophora]ACB43019.1 50S ribosomal protein L29 [Paulinella chromatophora]